MNKTKHFSAIIPAAGFSDRMGQTKALLPLKNGKILAENIIEQYLQFGCKKIVLVLNDTTYNNFDWDSRIMKSKQIKIIINKHPEKGRFYSIQMGLRAITSESHCFFHNVDNPPANSELLISLAKAVQKNNYVVPVYKSQKGHPILLGSDIRESILQADENSNLRNLLKNYSAIEANCPFPEILLNLNTKEEYEKYLTRITRLEY